MGATTIIGVEAVPERAEIARRLGADHVVDFRKVDPVDEIMRLTAVFFTLGIFILVLAGAMLIPAAVAGFTSAPGQRTLSS